MKSLFTLILAFLMTLPNCGMVFAGNMSEMMKSGEVMEMPERMSTDMLASQDASLQNPYYNCCSDAAHQSTLARDISVTNATKDVVSVARIATPVFREDFVPKKKESINILYRQNAPPDPSEYISLIGSSVKNLN
jgi:hypothetical protein